MYHARIDIPVDEINGIVADRRWLWSALAIFVAAVALRFGQFGNPLNGLDEQFYLLVGDRLWSGALPYVDIWDRKPVGLFLLFAAIRLLPGDGVLAAQIVATAFAATTGWLIAAIARRWVSWTAAIAAGIFYIAAAGELWVGTTQSPIFFNALVAGAALLTWQARSNLAPTRAIAAVALCGLAIQIKTNAVFPGCYFAGWLLWQTWRTSRDYRVVVRRAAAFAFAGAAPTLVAVAWYAGMGHLGAWWQANVVSVLAKGRPTDPLAIGTLWESAILVSPVIALALVGLWRRTGRFTRCDADTWFVLGWMGVGVADFLAIGGFFPHYAMALVLASTPLVAAAFDGRRWGPLLFVLAIAWPMTEAAWLNPRIAARERANAKAVVAALPADVRTRCLFIYEGPPIYYHLTHACLVSRYVFTAHLSSLRESTSLGVDPVRELDALMARRPGTVLTVVGSSWRDRNPAVERRLMRLLAGDYHLAKLLPYRFNPADGRLAMWRRN